MQIDESQSGYEKQYVTKSITIQAVIQNCIATGDYESLEFELPSAKQNPGLRPTLNKALICTIRNGRSSTGYLQAVQMLYSKGASLNDEEDGITSHNSIYRCHAAPLRRTERRSSVGPVDF